jgi:hypothetical protein
MNKVMHNQRKKLEIVTQDMEIHEETGLPIGKIQIKTRKKNAEIIFGIFNSIFEIDIKSKNKYFFLFYISKFFRHIIWRNGRTTCFHIHKTKIELAIVNNSLFVVNFIIKLDLNSTLTFKNSFHC